LKTGAISAETVDTPSVSKPLLDLEAALRNRGAILKGHFLLSSGLHSDTYFEKFRILEDPAFLKTLVSYDLARLKTAEATLVVGPTLGGALVAYQVAQLLGLKAYYAERGTPGCPRVFRRGFRFSPQDRILVVDDVLTTGHSVQETLDAIQREGAEPVAIWVLIDRSGGRVDLGIPLWALYQTQVESYPPEDCPLCRAGIPLVEPGGQKKS